MQLARFSFPYLITLFLLSATPASATSYPSLPIAALVDRLTWGITQAELAKAKKLGVSAYIEAQLNPTTDPELPLEIQQRIGALSISAVPSLDAVLAERKRDADVNAMSPGAARQEALKDRKPLSRQRAMETRMRATWYALYSKNQLQDQLTWFWMNHFNVHASKSHVGSMIADYESQSIRPHVLGKFRDILGATTYSPAMLVYLDNMRNRVGKTNENYARELLELHTLGVHGGYSQKDVQELSRVLTGLGVYYYSSPPRVKPQLQDQLLHQGLLIFNPTYHDFGEKKLLGQRITSHGIAEINEALDILAKNPATARHIATKLAQYFVADSPPKSLINSMTDTYLKTNGDITEILRTMFASQEFSLSLKTGKFKDPIHYVYSSIRLAYETLPPVSQPMTVINWLSRMKQLPYGRLTPDGYPISQSDWAGSSQITARFDFARLVTASPSSFYEDKSKNPAKPSSLPGLLSVYGTDKQLSPTTRKTIEEARSTNDANFFLISSPEFMYR